MNFFRTLTGRLVPTAPANDAEKGDLEIQQQEQERRQAQLEQQQRQQQQNQEYIDQTRRPTYVPSPLTYEKLSLFRFLVGITSDQTMETRVFDKRRPAPNLGIYARVVKSEAKYCKSFKIFSILINVCLGLQIIVAAALTALGASNSSSGAVTVFGAVNTVIAGFLTYLKGSGLPNRLKYFEDEWRKIREYIEQREREFSRDDCTLDVFAEAAAIDFMYQETKADLQANTPDSFVSATQMRGRATSSPSGLISKLSGHVPQAIAPSASAAAATARSYGDKVKDYAYDAQDKAASAAEYAEKEVKTAESKVAEVEQAGQDIANFASYRISEVTGASSSSEDHSFGLSSSATPKPQEPTS